MIYLYFRGHDYYPNPGFGDFRKGFHNKEQALKELGNTLEDDEWHELIEFDPGTLQWSIIMKEAT